MSFFYLIKRYLLLIILFALVWVWSWFWLLYLDDSKVQVKTQLFLIVAVKSENSSIKEIEEASTYFWETIIWWFRNPAFIFQIIWNNDWSWASINAFKQERQNMIIEVISDSKERNDELIKASFVVLSKKIQEFNSQSNVKYMALDQGRITSFSWAKNYILPGIWFIGGLILAFLILTFFEFARWSVSSIEQIEELFWIKVLDVLDSSWHNNDFTLLSVAVQKMKSIVILAWVNINTDQLAVSIAQRQSFFWEKLALVDWDLQRRSLQHTLWLSSRLKNLKWHTDAWTSDNTSIPEEKEEKTDEQTTQDIKVVNKTDNWNDLLYIQNTLDENLKFVPAWTWNKFLVQIFSNIASKMKTLIHTQLPDNFEVLRLKNASLVLVVKLWKTKLSDLKRINEVWDDEIKIVAVK